jgi:polysaccharide export outer membrane protein
MALDVEEISKPWRINSDGILNLPMVGRIKVAGITAGELEQEIASRLTKYVLSPQVTVFVSEVRSHPVTVTGAVARPGVLQLDRPTPLHEVLARAGGVQDPGPSVTVTRSTKFGVIPHPAAKVLPDGLSSVVELPILQVTQGYGPDAALELAPYDVISVSQEKRKRFVYVTGEVIRPGSIELVTKDSVPLTTAIAMAGGLARGASPKKTAIRHVSENGEQTVATVNLKPVLEGKQQDLTLRDGDIVVIPTNKVAGFLQSMSNAAITAGVYAGMYSLGGI